MDINIVKMRNHPINRDGETVAEYVDEGDLVGLTENAGEVEMVSADADSSVAQPAMGVAMEEVRDPTDVQVSGFDDAYIEQNQLRREVQENSNYTLLGEEETYISNGIYVEDVDGDLTLTPQEPVYLGKGGGVTQTKPSSTGDIIQYLGVAVGETTFLLDVDHDYETSA